MSSIGRAGADGWSQSVEAIRTHPVPLEIGKLTRELWNVDLNVGEDEPVEELVENAELKVGGQLRLDRRRRKTLVLKTAKSRGKSSEGGASKVIERLLEPGIDGARFAQHHPGRITVPREELQPAAKACLEHRSRAERPRISRGLVERFERLLRTLVKFIEDREEDALLAAEMQVERPSRHACPSNDVRDTGPPVAFAGKYPRSGVKQLLPAHIGCKQTSFR